MKPNTTRKPKPGSAVTAEIASQMNRVRRVAGARVIAVVAGVVLIVSSCAPAPEQRQADRRSGEALAPSGPALESPGERFIVDVGVIERGFTLDGEVEVTEVIAVPIPLRGFIATASAARGEPAVEGELLFSFEPALVVQAAATELEAARAALRARGGEDRAARVALAEEQATALGLPIDERADEPLADVIEVLAPQTGFIVTATPRSGDLMGEGAPPVEIGVGDSFIVRASGPALAVVELEVGDRAVVIADGEELVGVVTEVEIPASGLATVLVAVDSTLMNIESDVQIVVSGTATGEVLRLDPAAIREHLGDEYVVVLTSSGRRRIDLEVGVRTDAYVEVIADLVPGDVVIAP